MLVMHNANMSKITLCTNASSWIYILGSVNAIAPCV